MMLINQFVKGHLNNQCMVGTTLNIGNALLIRHEVVANFIKYLNLKMFNPYNAIIFFILLTTGSASVIEISERKIN